MKVKELIEKLETLPPEARVWSFDPFGSVSYDINVNNRLDEDGEIGVKGLY